MRALTEDVVTALQADNVPLLVLVELQFETGTVRCCNAGYNFEYGGNTWTGLGNLGGISAVAEGEQLEMYGITLTLSGVPPEMIALALSSGYQGRPATIWLAPLTNSYALLNDPVIIFKGRMDTMPIEVGNTATIQLTVESKLVDWERPRERRYNHADQISEYPDDLGFEFVAQMTEKEIIWGRA
jgi:hypothetical protein